MRKRDKKRNPMIGRKPTIVRGRSREDKVVSAFHGPESKLSWFVENHKNLGYDFWLVHGLNFLSSDYDTGVWDPVAPEIYHNRGVTRTQLYTRVMNRYLDPETNQLSPAGIHCLMWMALKPHEMYPLVWKIKWKSKEYGGEFLKEGDGQVWYLFQSLKPVMDVACSQWDTIASRNSQKVLGKVVDTMMFAKLEAVEEGIDVKRRSPCSLSQQVDTGLVSIGDTHEVVIKSE